MGFQTNIFFIVAAIVFPQRIQTLTNTKSKFKGAIQNNNKKRFAIYLKTENGCSVSAKKKFKGKFLKGMIAYARADDSIHQLV